MEILKLHHKIRVNNIFCPSPWFCAGEQGSMKRCCRPHLTEEGGCTRFWGLGRRCMAKAAYPWRWELKWLSYRQLGITAPTMGQSHPFLCAITCCNHCCLAQPYVRRWLQSPAYHRNACELVMHFHGVLSLLQGALWRR